MSKKPKRKKYSIRNYKVDLENLTDRDVPATVGLLYQYKRSILEKLRSHDLRFENLKKEIKNVRTELKDEIKNVRTELKDEIKNVRTELKDEIKNVRSELRGEIRSSKRTLQADITGIHATLKEIIASQHEMLVVLEEQRAENKVVLEGYVGMKNRQDRFEKRLDKQDEVLRYLARSKKRNQKTARA